MVSKNLDLYLTSAINEIKLLTYYKSNLEVYKMSKNILNDILNTLKSLSKQEIKEISTVDGFLVELNPSFYCKLLGDLNNLYGFSIYNSKQESSRFTLNFEQKSYSLFKFTNITVSFIQNNKILKESS